MINLVKQGFIIYEFRGGSQSERWGGGSFPTLGPAKFLPGEMRLPPWAKNRFTLLPRPPEPACRPGEKAKSDFTNIILPPKQKAHNSLCYLLFWYFPSAILWRMTLSSDKIEPLRELKRYLLFLKDYGVTEIPLNADLQVAHPSASPPRSPAEPAQPEMNEKSPDKIVNGKSPAEQLKEIREELGDCTRCKLCQGRQNIVFGSGNPEADLVFVGEGPGADEDVQGLPFVGRAGQKLTEIINKGMGLNRAQDTYICNIIKCRPPGNRDPEPDEIAACKPFLVKQLRAIRPKAIVALGKPAASTLLGRSVAITKERGTWHEFDGIPLMLTFHPAYLLRFYTLENRRAVLEDMKKVLAELKK